MVFEHMVPSLCTCFENWKKCRKHVNSMHTGKEFRCVECDRVFGRAEKLKQHTLIHTNIRDHMCDTCGKQFNRKDKLLDHIKRMHPNQSDARPVPNATKRFKPRVSSAEYHRFIYKCLECSQGFKRRGMLINHITKTHPSVALTSIPELNVPILRAQRDYYCLHCNRVYKTSTKRRNHMLKHHPGCVLPPGLRNNELANHNTYSQEVTSVTTLPYQCENCHKQYANKSKLLDHKRLKHSQMFFSTDKTFISEPVMNQHTVTSDLNGSEVVTLIQPLDLATGDSVAISLHGLNLATADRVDSTDLLTQAMSVNELQPSLDFQNQTHGLVQNSMQVAMPPAALDFRLLPNSNIDLNSLHMANIHNSSITFTVPNSSAGLTQPMQQSVLSNVNDTLNLNSVASHTSPRTGWPFHFKLN